MGIFPGAVTNVTAAYYFKTCAYDDSAEDPIALAEEQAQANALHDGSAYGGVGIDGVPSLRHSAAVDVVTSHPVKNQQQKQISPEKTPLISHNDSKNNLENIPYSRGNNMSGDSSMATALDYGEHNTANVNNHHHNNNSNSNNTSHRQSYDEENDNHNNNIPHHHDDASIGRPETVKLTLEGYPRGDMGTAKLVFLVQSSVFMLLALACCFPLDWAPFIGNFPGNSTAATKSFENGIKCAFDALPAEHSNECELNLIFFICFGSAFAFTNAGNVIVSQFSAPLTSMVSQVASPLTAIILVIFPAWSPQPENTNILMCVFAVILIIIAAAAYSFWEQMTSLRRREEQGHGVDGDEGKKIGGGGDSDGYTEYEDNGDRRRQTGYSYDPDGAESSNGGGLGGNHNNNKDPNSHGTLE
jgi:hypothetical protein